MKVLKFTLSGTHAFFKKPDVNAHIYFTYGNIHKVALLGLLGAVVGYKGYYSQNEEGATYPQFYKKLRHIKVGIVPSIRKGLEDTSIKGYFTKKIQTFNNTVGYANKDGNLIVKEQWIENPCWDIYLLLNNEESEKISDYILNSKSVFIPYLGKNDHFANIEDIGIIKAESLGLDGNINIDSIYLKDYFEINKNEFWNGEDEETVYKYEEYLPVFLEETTNQYITEAFIFTNNKLSLKDEEKDNNLNLYNCKGKNIFFF